MNSSSTLAQLEINTVTTNRSLIRPLLNLTKNRSPPLSSPHEPPVSAPRSYLDMAKVFMFSYFFWLVLCLIFITGTTRISVFCLGYLVACFYFMLFGSSLLMQPVRHVLRLWDWLIGYTCLVIAMKNLLSVSDGLRPHAQPPGQTWGIVEAYCWSVVLLFRPDHLRARD